jgi:hypothetical protein
LYIKIKESIKAYLLLRESDQGGVNNLLTRKSLSRHNKEQIIDIAWLKVSVKRKGGNSERGRCESGNRRDARLCVSLSRKDNTDSPKNRSEALMQVAMGTAQSAVAKDEMVKSVVQAYLTAGMAGIQQMVKDKIRDAFIDKVAEATGINPDLVRFATGRFEQAKFYPV